ncbi:DoxX family protein [Flavobacterium sp. HNIBRBA15423]|uniref:DoxX family protein n=1 Tax=Flavobacterium sp. HNIBRBA15423 TaxID=3458683 RepID=UPI0040441BAA
MMRTILIWVIKLTAVIILLQTLFFKFTGASESIYIFSTLGVEPYGRIGSGIIELIASLLILIPRTTLIGALLGLVTMFGAILSHFTILGIEVQNDGGFLFVLAIITFICCFILVHINRNKISSLVRLKI